MLVLILSGSFMALVTMFSASAFYYGSPAPISAQVNKNPPMWYASTKALLESFVGVFVLCVPVLGGSMGDA